MVTEHPTPVSVSLGRRYTTQLLEGSDYNVSLGFRDHVEPLLRAGKVNLMLVGHQHSYERSCPVYNGSCVRWAWACYCGL